MIRRARQSQRLADLPRSRDFYKQSIAWRERWLQHYVDNPHTLRVGLTITVHNQYDDPTMISPPQTYTVIAVHGDYLWLRTDWRPITMKKKRFLHEFWEARSTCYDAIYLRQEEVDEIKFGAPFLDRGDEGGIWRAHFDAAMDKVEAVALPAKPIPCAADLPGGKLQTVENGKGQWKTTFVAESGED